MELTDWLLFLHVLGAFVAVGALTALWGMVIATRPQAATLSGPAAGRLGSLLGPMVGGGLGVALIFGVWLALDIDGYELWDGWILASLVLWLLGGWAGGQAGRAFPAGERAKGIRFQAINSVALLVILILMIWKPGA